jgi:phosphoribosyl 1,2-cyclic phosphodiesterase
MNENFSVKFWGVRGSYPTPGPQTVFYGGNTACVSVQVAGQTIILDAGTGIIPLGRELLAQSRRSGQPVRAVLLFSHLHHDHTQGFPFFAPAYNPASALFLYGPGASEQALEDLLAHNQTPPAFPVTLREMHSTKEIHSLTETESLVLDETGVRLARGAGQNSPSAVTIRLMKSHAHPGGVYCYRIEWRGQSLVYATDTEGYVGGDRRLTAFAKGADLLIHDAQYTPEDYATKQGFGHSTPQMAAELARAAGVKRLALFHHDPVNDDETVHDLEEQAQTLFGETCAAREGQEIELADAQLAGARQFQATLNHSGIAVPRPSGKR